MKNYIGLLSRLHNTPLLMEEGKLRIITEAVTIPLLMGQAEDVERVPSGTNATVKEFRQEYLSQGRKVAIIPVFDSLVSKNASAGSGMTSYESISATMDALVEAGATDIGFYMDTPGGETSVFGLAEKIRSLPSRGVNTFAFCDQACSAGYAIAAATQRIYSTAIAGMGSIAAIAVHMEISKKAEAAGETYTVMRSKDSKALGDPYSKLSEAARDNFTSLLATLDTEFNNDVVKSRPLLTLEGIIKLDGRVLLGASAVEAGLADAIAPNLESALSQFLSDSSTLKQPKSVGVTMATPTIESLQAELAEAKTEITSLKASALEVAATHLKDSDANVALETERMTTILSTANTLKLGLATAMKYSDPKYSADIAKDIMTDLAEASSTDTGLDSSTGAGAAPEDTDTNQSTSLRDAYKAATNI